MAGGIGSRFWPKSRKAMPKQFLDILGTGKSFIRHTFERFLPIVPASNFIVVTNSEYRDLVLEHLPEINPSQILCEPIGRNTAPCIAYAAYYLASFDASAQMIVTPSDHYITDEELFCSTINDCVEFAQKSQSLMTVGIKPSRPETGYGYIQVSDHELISKVKCFTEKPNAELAETFVQCGEFMWNSGIFVWSVDSIVKAFKNFLPELDSAFTSIMGDMRTEREADSINRLFSDCKSISIDYGVMEKADNVYVRIGEFGWSDVGTWGSLFDHAEKDESGNIVPEPSFLYNTERTLISTSREKVVVVSGLSDYIVVDTDDVLMICPRAEEQNIKSFIEDIKYKIGEGHV